MKKWVVLTSFLVFVLLNTSCDPYIISDPFLPPFLLATYMDDIKEVKRFIEEEKVDINTRDSNGTTALFYVKSLEMAKYLVSQGADVNAKSHSGWTPLYEAVTFKRIAIARFLFQKGANPYAEIHNGSTPLSKAKEESSWYTFNMNKLIKEFETYTPPQDTIQPSSSDTEKQE